MSCENLFSKEINLKIQGVPFNQISNKIDAPSFTLMGLIRPNKVVNLGLLISVHSQNDSSFNKTYSLSTQEIGARVEFLLNSDGFQNGYYISASTLIGKIQTEETTIFSSNCSADFATNGFVNYNLASIGYQWFWDNGYNINAGLGYSVSTTFSIDTTKLNACNRSDIKTKDHGNSQKIYSDLGFGFAF